MMSLLIWLPSPMFFRGGISLYDPMFSVKGLCEGGLCEGGLCLGVSVKGVSMKGGLWNVFLYSNY